MISQRYIKNILSGNIVIVFLFASSCIYSQSNPAGLDSLRKKALNESKQPEYINDCFSVADMFMEINQYDSAQIWLNKIAGLLPLKEPSIANYFLLTRQAEVYYYNGLQRLGLQEAERSFKIAKILNDSLLLADANNFIGLFLINLDSNRSAIPYFIEGIRYARQPPYPENYLSLTKPHHLYGNMGEAYQKIGMYDSAVICNRISLQLAKQANWKRGIAVAYNSLGDAFLKLNKADSAFRNYQLSNKVTFESGDFDVELLNYGGLAKHSSIIENKNEAIAWLNMGLKLIDNNPAVNNLFTIKFLDDAISLFAKYKEKDMLALTLQKKSDQLQQQINNNNRQMNVILNGGLKNETRLLNMEVERVKQQNELINIRVYLLISFIVLGIAAFLLYRYKVNQKLHITRLQNKISQDLHDDVGSSLSSLQVYSTVAEQLIENEPLKAKEMLKKITLQSGALMDNIGDIVWSMKQGEDRPMQLNGKIKNYVSDVLSASDIMYTIDIEEGVESIIKKFEAKKNILLIIKEAITNVVKHSSAAYVAVSVKKLDEYVCVQVADNGKGFEAENNLVYGDGLGNMKKRTEELKGIFEINSHLGKGTTVSALLPIPNISDTV
jgi:signal transduction histidine kinase